MIERKYEIFMNLVLFQNIIVKFWNDRMSQDTILLLVRAGMVLTNIRIWRDFIIARDSGLVTMEKELVKKSKRKQKSRKSKVSLQAVTEKDSEETGSIQSSEETVIDKEQSTHLFQPSGQIYKAKGISDFSADERSQEVILKSSDSENERKAEPKKSDKEIWKFRLPKKSSKYVPGIKEDVECKDNDLWLSKRYPAEFEKNALTIKSFRDDMMSKDTYSHERSNTCVSAKMNQSSSLMAKRTSINTSPLYFPSPSSLTSWSDTQEAQPRYGKSLRPRSTQDALSKLDIL